MNEVITTRGLIKNYGATQALSGLDLEVAQGEVHGFLGPNGAGKTTTLRILLGLLRYDGGEVAVMGRDPWHDAVKLHRDIAYVPGDVELWPNLTGGEAIDLFGRLRGNIDSARRDSLIERFDLDPTKKGRTYSKGNRQKVAIVAALASDAGLLLLDEPTAGLDPLMEVVFQGAINDLRREGRTVLLSSHILAQVEKLADRISIVRQGEIVQTGTLADMRHLSRTVVEAETSSVPSGLEAFSGVHDVSVDSNRIRFSVEGQHLDAAMRHVGQFGLQSLVSHPPTLEELMLRHYGNESPVRE